MLYNASDSAVTEDTGVEANTLETCLMKYTQVETEAISDSGLQT